MASNIKLDCYFAPVNSFVIYGSHAAAKAASGKYYWTAISGQAGAPIEIITRPGFQDIDTKFMGGKTPIWTIHGFVIDASDGEKAIWQNAIDLTKKNKINDAWDIYLDATGGHATISLGQARLMDIVLGTLDSSQGKQWPFVMQILCLGAIG